MELLESGSYYTDKDGIIHPIPKRKTKYELYGLPEPTTKIEGFDRFIALNLTGPGARKNLIIEYLREAPTAQEHMVETTVKGKQVMRKKIVASRGVPIGALVAFERNYHVYVGWSKRNTKFETVWKKPRGKDKEELVDEPVEKLSFTKTDALQVAILRALTDKIIIIQRSADSPSMRVRTGDDSFLPHVVEKSLPAFVERVSEHFGSKVSNVEKRPVITLSEGS